MTSIYESGEYLQNKPDWHAGDSPVKARWISEILERNRIAPAHIVEIGCGSGEILVELSRRYPHALLDGYEISPQAFAIASAKAQERLRVHHGDFQSLNTKPDVLMAVDVLEHVDDYIGFLRSMKDRGDYKLFHIPLDLSVQMVLRSSPILNMREKIGHLHYFYKDTALATLAHCGYQVVDWRYTRASEELPKSRRALLLNLPRRLLRAVNEDFAVRLLGGSSLLVLAR